MPRIQRSGERLNDLWCYIAISYYNPDEGIGKVFSNALKMLNDEPCRSILGEYWLIQAIKNGITREELVKQLGEPEQIGGITNKHKLGTVYRYGRIEIGFHENEIVYAMNVGDCGTKHDKIV